MPKLSLRGIFSKRGAAEDDDTACQHQPKTFSTGIKVWHDSSDSNIDIVFVHGLTGDRDATWTARDATEPWPKTLLPSVLPKSRILTFGYDAGVVDLKGVVSQARVNNHAWNLLATLSAQREDDEDGPLRPIVFVCHSLGGLVCEDALTTARQRSEPHLRKILDSTCGIVFLGTPHHGSGLARWAEALSRSLGLVKQTNTNLLSVLKQNSEVLARIQDDFHTMIKARETEGTLPIKITCFFEELPLHAVGLVVRQDSAILPGYIPIGIKSDHMGMTKFVSAEDPGFQAVCAELKRRTKEAEKARNNILSQQLEAEEIPRAPTTINIQPCPSDLCLIDPEEDLNQLKRRKGARAENTCEWMVHTEEITAWLGPGKENILWLHGLPGTGKSTMSIFLAENPSAIFSGSDAQNKVSYFFCDSGNQKKRTATSIIRGLLYQLFRHHPQLLDYFWDKYNRRKDLYESFDALWLIFMEAAADPHTGRKYFIIDALDECDQESQETLLKQLENSFSNSNKTNSNIRILLTSRPYPEMEQYLKGFTNKDLASYPQRKEDIELYIKDRVNHLARGKRYTDKVKERVSYLLQEKAEGTFLWVSLACEQLGRTKPKEAVRVLEDLHPGLPSLYGKLLEEALEQDGEVVVRILKLVAVSLRPLSVRELSEICQLNVDEKDLGTRDQYTRDDIASCRLMVFVQDEKVLLLHKSVRDHLSRAGYLDEMDTHAEIAYRCIDMVIDPMVYSSNYPSQNWPQHARMAQSKFAVQDSQAHFFEIDSPCREKWLDEIRGESFGAHLPKCFSILHMAAAWGLPTLALHAYNKAKEMKYLGISSNLCDGLTPFELAVQSRDASIEVISVLMDKFEERVTTRLLIAAAGNRGNGGEVIKFLLDRQGDQITVTKDVVIAAGENWENGEEVMKLLLNYQGGQIEIGQEVVIAAAANRGNAKGVLELLLDYQDKIIITEEVVKIAAGNRYNAVPVMTLLLDRRRDQVRITEDVLIAAAENWQSGEEVLRLLFDCRKDDVKITENVVISAAGNWMSGEAVMKLLLDRRGAQVKITEQVLKAAVKNRGSTEGLLKLLLDHLLGYHGRIEITDEIFWKTPAGTLNHSEVKKLLNI